MEILEWQVVRLWPAMEAAVVDRAPIVVVEVGPDQLDHPAHLADQEIQELLEDPASPVAHLNPCVPNKLLHHASHAQAVNPDHPAHQDPMDSPEHPDSQDTPAASQHQVSQDLPVHQDQMETLVSPEAQDNLALQLKANLLPQPHQDHLEMLDRPAAPASQEALANPEDLEHRDQRDHPVDPDSPETMDNQVNPATLANPVELERKVSAPSTAPSMVESSSRMEPADAKHHLAEVVLWLGYAFGSSSTAPSNNIKIQIIFNAYTAVLEYFSSYFAFSLLFVATAMNCPLIFTATVKIKSAPISHFMGIYINVCK